MVRVEKTKEKRLVLRRTGFFVVFFCVPFRVSPPTPTGEGLARSAGKQRRPGNNEFSGFHAKKKNKDKNVRTDGEGWWWWWFVLRRRRQGKQKKGKTVGSGGCGGQLSGRVWSAYWFFLKKWTTNVRSCGEETRGVVPSFCRRSAARPLVCGGDTSKRTSFVSGFAFLLERAEGGVSG